MSEELKKEEVVEEKKPDEKTPSKNELLRELSKELGINAFDPKEIKSKFDKFNEWQEAQKSERDKLQEQVESYKTKENDWMKEKAELLTKHKAEKLNIDPDKLDKALKLADNDPDKLDEVIKEFPSFISTKKKEVEVNLNQKKHDNNEDTVSPFLAAFRKKRGIS